MSVAKRIADAIIEQVSSDAVGIPGPFPVDYLSTYLPDITRESALSKAKVLAFPSGGTMQRISRTEVSSEFQVSLTMFFSALNDDGSPRDTVIGQAIAHMDLIAAFIAGSSFAVAGKQWAAARVERDPMLGVDELEGSGIGFSGLTGYFS